MNMNIHATDERQPNDRQCDMDDQLGPITPETKTNRRDNRSKFESLLQFLDDADNESHKYRTGSDRARLGLADVTNTRRVQEKSEERIACQIKKKFQDPSSLGNDNSSSASPGKVVNKRYIWDDWEVNDPSTQFSDEAKQAAGESKTEKLSAVRQQLLDLKTASEEIQSKAAKLKADQNKLKNEVEHLHSIRIENEANHIKTMKRLKKDFQERKTEIEAKNDKVRERES